jgi:hypothetical protein
MDEKAKEVVAWMLESLRNVLFRWIFDDLIFAVLPLFILAAVDLFIDQHLVHFMTLKEWSFANIVICGVVVRKINQRRSGSRFEVEGVFSASTMMACVALLILSVLILALVILCERRVFAAGVIDVLGTVQVGFFVLSAVVLLVVTASEEDLRSWAIRWIYGRQKKTLLEGAQRELAQAFIPLNYLHEAIERGVQQRTSEDGAFDMERYMAPVERLELTQMLVTLDAIDKTAEAIRARIQATIAAKRPGR